jgi:hypothetical protein
MAAAPEKEEKETTALMGRSDGWPKMLCGDWRMRSRENQAEEVDGSSHCVVGMASK